MKAVGQDKRPLHFYADSPSQTISVTAIGAEQLGILCKVLERWAVPSERERREGFYELEELKRYPGLHVFYELVEKNVSPVPYRSLFRILCKDHFKVNLLLVESPYLSMEFWDTYAHVHSRSFYGRSKKCCRVHFFVARNDDYDKLIGAVREGRTQAEIQKGGFKYYGFMTLRPAAPPLLWTRGPSGIWI